MIDTVYGREDPRLVVERFAICAECPVRIDCLTDAIGEHRWTVTGIWGGTTWSERTHAVSVARYAGQPRASIAADLEATFTDRDFGYRIMARTPCRHCGQVPLWRGVPQVCTRACRSVQWRERKRRRDLDRGRTIAA